MQSPAALYATGDCAPAFVQLTAHLITAENLQKYQTAISEAAQFQYLAMTKNLNTKELLLFHQSLERSRISSEVSANTNGHVQTSIFGKTSMEISPKAAAKSLGMTTVIHESQHLIDRILKPNSVWNAPSFTLRSERRAFLRQNAFLRDVIGRIGIDGVSDMLLRAVNLPADQHTAAKRVVQYMMLPSSGRDVQKDELVIIGRFFDSLPEEKQKEAFRFLGDFTGLSDRREYLQLGPAYADRIRSEQFWRLTKRQDEQLSTLVKLIAATLLANEGYKILSDSKEK